MAELWVSGGLFILAAGVIAGVGPRLSQSAERLGEVTGVAQTLAGALFLGASTSLPGLIISFKTALGGEATIALGNSLGGIAAQTMFIALADVALRKSTLQHEDTLAVSLMQSAVVISLLTLVLLAMIAPAFSVWNVHPASSVIAVGVVLGFRMIQQTRQRPQWRAQDPDDSNSDEESPSEGQGSGSNGRSGESESPSDGGGDEESQPSSIPKLVGNYLTYLTLVGAAGWLISAVGSGMVSRTGLSPLVMGATGLAIVSSLPELVTAVSAVRRESVALAIGDIVGGNAFDTVMVAIADLAYRQSSIYRAGTAEVMFLTALVVLMTGILLVGFVRRDRRGLGNIGIESYLIILIYAFGVVLIVFAGGAFSDA